MKINLLRQKILDLAIRGKLVPQDPNDEPASVLLERIRAEKERLIAEGKIKRPKKSKATSSESHYQQFEPPFAIPESWEWVRLGELVEFRGGYAYKSNTYVGSSNWQVVRIGNVKNDKLLLDSQPVFVPEQIGNDTIKYQIQPDDILFTMTGTKGKRDYFYSVKVPPTSTKLLLNQRVGCLRCIANVLYINYLCNVLKSTYILDTIFATETGNVSQGNIGSESTLSLYIPLPPYPEQERIVKALNELVLTLYGIDNCRGKLQETIQNAKSKILDLAMQGKLVPQDPADEPAATMLRRINPKAKIITDNQHYWNIPKSWCWCQLGDIFKHNTGKALNSSNKDGIAYEYITTSNVYWGKFELHSLKKMLFKDNEIDKCLVKKGDLLICEGGDVGRAAVWDLDTTIMIQNHLHRLRPYSERISAKLYCIFMKAFKDKQLIGGKGIALQGFSSNALHKLIMPLPPASEQKRILAKIEELFSVLDSIKASLQS